MSNTKQILCHKKFLIGILCSFVGISFLCNMIFVPTTFQALARKIYLGYYYQIYHLQDTNADSSIAQDKTHSLRSREDKGMSIENKHLFIDGRGISKINATKLDWTNSVSLEFDELSYLDVKFVV